MIRVRSQGKYELLPTACEDDVAGAEQVRVEGVLNRRRDGAAAADLTPDGETTTSFTAEGSSSIPRGPRQRRTSTSRGESKEEEKRGLLGRGPVEKGAKDDMVELSQKMVGEAKSSKNSSSPSLNPEFIEVNIKEDDTLQGLALRFRCPVSELKRVNNIYSTQDIHSFQKIKVPVKKHGLLRGILDDDAQKRRSKQIQRRAKQKTHPSNVLDNPVDDIARRLAGGDDDDDDIDDDGAESTSRIGKLVDLSDDNEEGNERLDSESAYTHTSPSSPLCRYGIKDLENLFPNRDISDCESGAESRRHSAGSDSDSAPLVRTFYLSIRENMASSPDQSHLAKQFLSKMDADLSAIRKQRSTHKESLEEVASSLTSVRIRPLASSPPPSTDDAETYGTILGMSWWKLLAVALAVGIFISFVFYNYAKEQKEEQSAHHHHSQHEANTQTLWHLMKAVNHTQMHPIDSHQSTNAIPGETALPHVG